MNDILIPTMLFWENGNTWYGSKGLLRFFIKPVKQEDAGTTLDIELWRGPLAKEFSEIMETASFPLSEEGLTQVTAWLEARAAQVNS